jgi:hypothetical protein
MAFGTFAEIEILNPAFRAAHDKMRVTVDTEREPGLPAELVLRELAGAFPGLARHQCRAGAADGGVAAAGTHILLVPDDASANQAHVLEHLTLELLAALDERVTRLSGVTCAYTSPPERNDVFVECDDHETGALAAWLATEMMNGVLAGVRAQPLYGDVLGCARRMRAAPERVWTPRRLASAGGLSVRRAAEALGVLSRARLVDTEEFTFNFSGEPHYRCTAAGAKVEVGQGLEP